MTGLVKFPVRSIELVNDERSATQRKLNSSNTA